MEKRIQAERLKGLYEIKVQIDKLVEVKEHVDAGDLVKIEIENMIIELVKERVVLEKRLNGLV